MAFQLTDTEKLAPSERLAKNLEHFKDREGEKGSLDEQQETCVGQAVSLIGFSTENVLREINAALSVLPNTGEAIAARYRLESAKGWLSTILSETKDASFILDGYHAWHKQNAEWEEEVSEDLDICGYAGKWKSAKEGVTREKPDLSGSAYWDAVRTYFLELGGCYLSERCEPTPIDWEAPLPRPIIPVVGDWSEPMKVRQA